MLLEHPSALHSPGSRINESLCSTTDSCQDVFSQRASENDAKNEFKLTHLAVLQVFDIFDHSGPPVSDLCVKIDQAQAGIALILGNGSSTIAGRTPASKPSGLRLPVKSLPHHVELESDCGMPAGTS